MRVSSPSLISQKGFTIVEVIVVIAVVGILTSLVLGPIGDFYQANTVSLGRATKESDIRGVLRQIEKDLTNNKNFSDTYTVAAPLGAKVGSSWGANWSYTGMGGNYPERRVLVASVPATSALPSNDPTDSRYPIFATAGTCPAEPTASLATSVAIVYYMAPAPTSSASQPPSQSNPYNLYRRTIVPELTGGATYCYGRTPAQRTTCAPGVSNAVCRGIDALLVSDIRSFEVDYFVDQNIDTVITGQYTASPASPITGAKAIRITAKTGQIVNGAASTIEASIRISRMF